MGRVDPHGHLRGGPAARHWTHIYRALHVPLVGLFLLVTANSHRTAPRLTHIRLCFLAAEPFAAGEGRNFVVALYAALTQEVLRDPSTAADFRFTLVAANAETHVQLDRSSARSDFIGTLDDFLRKAKSSRTLADVAAVLPSRSREDRQDREFIVVFDRLGDSETSLDPTQSVAQLIRRVSSTGTLAFVFFPAKDSTQDISFTVRGQIKQVETVVATAATCLVGCGCAVPGRPRSEDTCGLLRDAVASDPSPRFLNFWSKHAYVRSLPRIWNGQPDARGLATLPGWIGERQRTLPPECGGLLILIAALLALSPRRPRPHLGVAIGVPQRHIWFSIFCIVFVYVLAFVIYRMLAVLSSHGVSLRADYPALSQWIPFVLLAPIVLALVDSASWCMSRSQRDALSRWAGLAVFADALASHCCQLFLMCLVLLLGSHSYLWSPDLGVLFDASESGWLRLAAIVLSAWPFLYYLSTR